MSFSSAKELSELMAEKCARAEKISKFDLRQMNRVLALAPEDMTVTVETGISLGALQSELAKHHQWLPVDPPNAASVSIHEILSKNLSGPRRFGFGTIREHLIGMKIILADGRVIKSGGNVVKNVAGYDLAKLFIGARDSLGIIVEATFKVRPLPELERITSLELELANLTAVLRSILDSDLTPVILDLHRLSGASNVSVTLGLAGTRAEVEWQAKLARTLGFVSDATLDYEGQFWKDGGVVNRISVLPSRVAETIAEQDLKCFIARAGNGVIYCRNAATAAPGNLPTELMRRIKAAYDPKNILPDFQRAAGLQPAAPSTSHNSPNGPPGVPS